MTQEELKNRHLELVESHNGLVNIDTDLHVCASIEYAISVLEELRDYLMSIHHHNSAAHTENKIEELKKLIV